MATTAKVYLSDGLPIEVKNAHRVIYFPDQSAHVLDSDDRPVFIAAPGRYVAIHIEYAMNEEVDPRQKIPGPVVKRHTAAIVPVIPTHQESTQERPTPQSPPPGFPYVGESKPAPHPEPGEVKVTSLNDRGPDGETTHEMKIPVREVPHQDFLRAPQTAGRP